MIWRTEPAPDRNREALREHIVRSLGVLSAVPPEDGDLLHAVSDAVAVFCTRDQVDRYISDDLLSLAIARALIAAAEEDLAKKVLHGAHQRKPALSSYLPLVRQPGLPGTLWDICANRALRPLELVCAGPGAIWAIDFRKMERSSEELLELLVFDSLRYLLRHLVKVWDVSDGHGGLALLGYERVKTFGKEADPFDFCREVLDRAAATHGWSEIPQVLALEVPVRKRKKAAAR